MDKTVRLTYADYMDKTVRLKRPQSNKIYHTYTPGWRSGPGPQRQSADCLFFTTFVLSFTLSKKNMDAKRILFITQEVTPYIPDTLIGDISRNLPQGVQERGYEIRTFMPKYGCINERRNQLHEVIRLSGMNLIIDDTDHPLIIKVASIQMARMQVYFIDNEDFFHRKATLTDESGNGFPDNDERTIFFVRGVYETVRKLRWMPDIIHCHGWFSALAPLYLKRKYFDDHCFARSKVVYSLYDQSFQPALDSRIARRLKQDGATERDLKLFVDGARLAYALASPSNDVTLADLARLTDVFYIGGTKCGALFGEAVVFPKPNTVPHFFTIVKQSGALLAKGRVLGIQFDTLFTDGLYERGGAHATLMANRIRTALTEKGYALASDAPTNQIFLALSSDQLAHLSAHVGMGFWEKQGKVTVMRIATSWATQEADVERLIALL